MAPFKLKFRMGSSRSTSQEHDSDPQVNEALLNHHHSTAIGASSSTIDSADCNSLASMGTNERKSLLPNKTNILRLGYLNHNINACTNASDTASGTNALPTTPPPSYEHVLEENTRLGNTFDYSQQQQQQRQLSTEDNSQHSRRSSTNNTNNLPSLEQLNFNDTPCCTDPECQENYINNEKHLQRQLEIANDEYDEIDHANEDNIENRKESVDSTELLISTRMTAPSSQEYRVNDKCTSECQHYNEQYGEGACGGSSSGGAGRSTVSNDFFDPLMNHNGYCNDETHYEDYQEHAQNQDYLEGQGNGSDSDDGGWNTTNQMSSSQHQYQQQEQQQYTHSQQERSQTPEIISNKSSKEIYKDLAKQWGITCKMSDGCRCMECQSHYFDCEFDDNEHQKTDGGLGAGTPMFISEVMHGSACNIL